ncbi:MAG: hypothetical protein BWY68_00548 [bacterium ADurb.Bin400]|nr:MAG: hypothetical protein BWY68_00548 [bacterium ADurb.Bin400]
MQDQTVFDSVETTVFYAPTDQNEVAVDRMKLKRAAIDRYPYDSYDSGGAWSVRSPGLYLVEIRGIRLRGEVTVNVIVPLKVLESKG